MPPDSKSGTQPSREELFAIWAPSESPWSAWAKPVLFADAPLTPLASSQEELPEVTSVSRLRHAAVIVDVPGRESVLIGVAMAKAGFQPVPLYNAGSHQQGLIDMDQIAGQLTAAAGDLAKLRVKADAPPVFLMNSDRMLHGRGAKAPGKYDNRWSVVPQDMPSAEFLKGAGITQVVLVSDEVRPDLAHILFRYQQAGLMILKTDAANQPPKPVQVAKPNNFRSLWYRAGVFAGLTRNAAGGFGAMIPNPTTSTGGGYYGGG